MIFPELLIEAVVIIPVGIFVTALSVTSALAGLPFVPFTPLTLKEVVAVSMIGVETSVAMSDYIHTTMDGIEYKLLLNYDKKNK